MQARNPRFRYVALAAVIALHLALLLMAQRIANIASRVTDVADHALIWLQIDRPEPPRERTQVPLPKLSTPRAEVIAPTLPNEPNDAIESEPTRPLPPRLIDWRANAARSAEKIVGSTGQPSHRSFGSRTPQQQVEAEPPSMFPDPPKNRSGDVDKDAGGDPIVWTNNNCYTELDKLVQTARDWVNAGPGSFSGPQIRCIARGTVGNDTMFDHLKKREEPPVPKAGTEMNALPERVESSGARDTANDGPSRP